MKPENVLDKILFGGTREPARDPNNPRDQPFFAATEGIRQQAFATWLADQGGEFVMEEVERDVKEKLEALVVMPIRTLEDVFKVVSFRQNLVDDVNWYGKIISAFNKEEERQEKMQVREPHK